MKNSKNIILIGDGAIGSSYAFNCLMTGVGKSIGIIDINMKRVQGDVEDLRDALPYTSQQNIYAANYADCRYADLIVITAGLPQKPGQTRLELIQKNAVIIKDISNQIMANDFDGIIVIASNPVDILTELVFKTTGLPRNQVIGSGTALDSARLRSEISQRFNVDARSVSGYILGEHGDSEFPVWDFTTIGGQPIRKWIPENRQDEVLEEIATTVKDAAYSIISQKGATFYGIAASLTRITQAILNDDLTPFALSIHLTGEYGLSDVSIGVPAIIGANGLDRIIELDLNEEDAKKMSDSAKLLKNMDIQNS
ncbi:L-lactate dehydrogenase [Agrilactobacillus composti DSM 18527 = JCM 14202]|uniref:L-lactate dehydrogenase n=1 Tax=Agrilactobacillus composti DSM 18527 = JCM 14202 TaxID=1423734 RepID=X0PRM6_9LACO|nr:L-lactate dehydrogenase [Agrilactobacillus composti]KRM35088.1 L-lactate dehydrogenase [Agrilactobacillus composti DSM 18527 = JCM 14202]GAF40467.1 L-lactate dehydrogenase [Agrilactobacillus composti DSM 18527 = JCM 14202]